LPEQRERQSVKKLGHLSRRLLSLAAALVALTLGAAPAQAGRFWSEVTNVAAPSTKVETLPDFVDLAQRLSPAVVNVASMCGRRALPAWTEYSASKYALCGLTEALRGEYARFGVDVLLVLPGLTASAFHDNLLRNEGRMEIDFASGMIPAQTAAGIVRALRRNRTETVLGGDARWMLRFHRFFPRLLDRLIARRVRKLYSQEPEVRDQKSEVRSQKSEIRSQRSEVRDQRSEVRGQKSEVQPTSDL